MGAKYSINQNSHSQNNKKFRTVSQNLRLSTNIKSIKRHSPTPPMSPPGTNSVQSDASLVSATNSFNYIDNTQKGETDRNHVKHFGLKVLFEGNVLKSISDKLDFTSSELRVLDVGCGSGTWLLDMATEYPNVQFTGIDQISSIPQDIRPSNIDFSVQDVLCGLSFEDNSFDFVQMRLFSMTFDRAYWVQALAEVYRVLKPGGYIQLLEPRYDDTGDEFVRDYSTKVVSILNANDQDPNICENLTPLLENNGYTPVEFVEKIVNLKTHPLRNEFLYIIRLTLDSCKPYVIKICEMTSDEQYLEFQEQYMEHLIKSSESVWTACAGMKPLN
ncbi:S-adenosyl-L-methionine-dependent methyltransferase [Mucor mucedo]|uniref:S-adenosyl-L-methionine-dependent methyltransferase n=1 Tax=Mucor mucedo TaxID=29922 RepID=UPI00221F6F34|nr:S-adenosyl-L-methionine-dependent methyltransferase [Mucor mucedo]KAI7889030.1 S-adenosyl-L-methionine-dependent methyltransferase [Mucor mucedo]